VLAVLCSQKSVSELIQITIYYTTLWVFYKSSNRQDINL